MMQTIDRRVAVAGLALLTVCPPARAATPEQLSIDADEGPVPLTRYAAEQDGKRPQRSAPARQSRLRTQAPRLRALCQHIIGKGYRRLFAPLSHGGRCAGIRSEDEHAGEARSLRGNTVRFLGEAGFVGRDRYSGASRQFGPRRPAWLLTGRLRCCRDRGARRARCRVSCAVRRHAGCDGVGSQAPAASDRAARHCGSQRSARQGRGARQAWQGGWN